jgi:hypothetical protein
MSVTAVPAVRVSGLAWTGMVIIIAGIIFLQRLGIPLRGDEVIPITLFTSLLGIGLMVVAGVLTLSRWRTELWAFTVVAIMVSTFCQTRSWSALSMWFLLVVYTPLIFVAADADDETYKSYLEPFQWFMIPVALLGVYQFVTVDTFDPFARFGDWVITNFNTHPALSYGSRLLRSNAYVLLEPSFFSQYCAIAILMEMTFYRRWWRLPVYAAGLFCAASGTGTVVLLVFIVSWAWHHKKLPHLAVLGAVGLIAIATFSHNEVIGTMLGRTTEIEVQDSSAYGRFVWPFIQMSIQLTDIPRWITGLGPGSASGARLILAGWRPDEVGTLMAPLKMLIEYGLIGAAPFTIFITRAFFDHSRSFVVSFAMFLCFMVMSTALQHPPAVYLSYVISMMFPTGRTT